MAYVLLADCAGEVADEDDEVAGDGAGVVGVDGAELVGASLGVEDGHFACDPELFCGREDVGGFFGCGAIFCWAAGGC